jgi:hypothetical protein
MTSKIHPKPAGKIGSPTGRQLPAVKGGGKLKRKKK